MHLIGCNQVVWYYCVRWIIYIYIVKQGDASDWLQSGCVVLLCEVDYVCGCFMLESLH